jgi:hypothetical protein
MFDGLHREINVEIRPIQVMGARKLDVRDLSDGRFTKPGKLAERNEQLALADEQPKAVG